MFLCNMLTFLPQLTLPRLSYKFVRQNNFTSCVMAAAAYSIFLSKVAEKHASVQADLSEGVFAVFQ